MWGKARGALYLREKKSILLEGTQATPARPSDKNRMGVKTLGWWVVKAWDRDGRILFHDSLLSVCDCSYTVPDDEFNELETCRTLNIKIMVY
jgi:hypothetical protein